MSVSDLNKRIADDELQLALALLQDVDGLLQRHLLILQELRRQINEQLPSEDCPRSPAADSSPERGCRTC